MHIEYIDIIKYQIILSNYAPLNVICITRLFSHTYRINMLTLLFLYTRGEVVDYSVKKRSQLKNG